MVKQPMGVHSFSRGGKPASRIVGIQGPALPLLVVCALALLMAVLSGAARAQNGDQEPVRAFVDNADLSENEVITLTIRVGSRLGDSKPVLTGLERDFIQLGTTIHNRTTLINGSRQAWTDYVISLAPRSPGSYTIPSFRVGGEMTQPITVNVGAAAQNSSSPNDEIFITTSVDKEEAYVQEQVLLTVRLYYSIAFGQDANLSTPQVADSVVQRLGDDEHVAEMVNNLRYNVTERKFVIFPQSSGALTIPPVYFTASVGGGRSSFGRALNRSRSSRQVQLTSATHQVHVKPKPASFPGGTWLPASNVSIEESWSGDPGEMQVGQALTRNIRMTARGLSSSLLPGIEYPEVEGLKFYPDQPASEDVAGSGGVTASRAESIAVVPSEGGQFRLPEIRIPWWDTDSDSLQYASVPATALRVQGTVSPTAMAPPPGPDTGPQALAGGPGPADTGAPGLSSFWISTTAVFALAWAFTTMLWLRNRRLPSRVGSAPTMLPSSAARAEGAPDLDAAFRHLQQACRQQDLRAIKGAVINWGQAYFSNRNIRTLTDLKVWCDNPTLSALLFNLEQALYSEAADTTDFRGSQLCREITAIHKSGRREARHADRYSLPPLYRN